MPVLLTKAKTENELWTDLFSIINMFLASFDDLTGWTIRQNQQRLKQTFIDNTLYISRVYSRRVGYQGKNDRYDAENAVMIHKESYTQEIMYQITAFQKQKTAIDTVTAADVCNRLISYIMSSKGLSDFQKKGMRLLRITELLEPAIISDSANFEKLPKFDFTVIIRQADETVINSINNIEGAILKGV